MSEDGCPPDCPHCNRLAGRVTAFVDKELENGIDRAQLSRLMLKAAVRIAKDDPDTAYLSLVACADFLRGAADKYRS